MTHTRRQFLRTVPTLGAFGVRHRGIFNTVSDPPLAVASRSFSRNPTLRQELLNRYPGSRFNDEGEAVLSGDRLVHFLGIF